MNKNPILLAFFCLVAPLAIAADAPGDPQKVQLLCTWQHPWTNVAFRVYQRVLPSGPWSVTNTPVGVKQQLLTFDIGPTNEVQVTAMDDIGLESDPSEPVTWAGTKPPKPNQVTFTLQIVVTVP
jgi:hypothetical protein